LKLDRTVGAGKLCCTSFNKSPEQSRFLSRNISHDLVGLVYENHNTIHKLQSLFAPLVCFTLRFTPGCVLCHFTDGPSGQSSAGWWIF
jgi:hypothetical protein